MVGGLDQGSIFIKYYAALSGGTLKIYKNEKEYEEYGNVICEPFNMVEYRLVLDPDEIRATSINPGYRIFRKRVSGHANLTFKQAMASTDGVNLGEAAQKYAFNLVPKVRFRFVNKMLSSAYLFSHRLITSLKVLKLESSWWKMKNLMRFGPKFWQKHARMFPICVILCIFSVFRV